MATETVLSISLPPSARIVPNRSIYHYDSVPMLLVWAWHGLSAGRFDEIATIAISLDRTFFGGKSILTNVPMQRPTELAHLVSTT